MHNSKRIENQSKQILGFPRVGNYSKPRVLNRKVVGKNPVIVAGIDEAGRGPLAGPVVAVAVVSLPRFGLGKTKPNLGRLRDSKQLSRKQREHYYRLFVKEPTLLWGIGRVGERMIDRINIYQATRLAMLRAVNNLSKLVRPDLLMIDGIMRIKSPIPQQCIVKGDEKVQLISIASIIAKVVRDRWMLRSHRLYPQYGFDRHKGYGTKEHILALQEYGLTPIHRRSFEPCRSAAYMLD